jgi:hypothetical protein
MATKRSTGSEPVVSSGAAPARAKSTVTRKHRNSAVNERSESATAPSSAAAAPASSPKFDEIAELAYTYWEARGYQGGSSEEDWLRAEQALRAGLTMSVAN